MADVIPIDPEQGVQTRSQPVLRLARLIGFAHPQCHALMHECRQAAYPPEFAERAKAIADEMMRLRADMQAFDAVGLQRVAVAINQVMARVRVHD